MKTFKIVSGILIMLLALHTNAQNMDSQEVEKHSDVMNATITYTLAYTDNGIERPYKVTIRKKRKPESLSNKVEVHKAHQNATINTENVAVLLTITNAFNPADDRVISMRYNKSINDNFTLEPSSYGFLIQVDEKVMKYTIGKGISFPTPSDQNYFKANEFDIIK